MTKQLTRPAWKKNIGGIVGAVGYVDSAGQIVIVMNWRWLIKKANGGK